MDHVKNFYKLDLSETMKTALKNNAANSQASSSENMPAAGIGYVTEKLYMLLQLYLQNKGWNPSVELLQCFTELKDSIPNVSYLQVLASRLALDAQGRLILRDSGKIVLPFEHFANAVMLKHMSGPHGLHLSLEATIRAVVESYTIGRENFGMEKDFIIEVVQSCPSGGCRYYKNHGHMGMPPIPPFIEQSPYGGLSPDFVQHMLPPPHPMGQTTEIDLTKSSSSNSSQKNTKQQHQQQITAAIIQQQNRAIAAQQSLEKFNSMSTMEKQRFLQQLDKKHYETIASSSHIQQQMQGLIQANQIQATQPPAVVPPPTQPPPPPTPQASPSLTHLPPPSTPSLSSSSSTSSQMDFQKNDIFKASLECIESNKDLLALHNGAWGNVDNRETGMIVGQDKIVRAFSELMRNMARMKTYIRPTMCKPYGKQSESLQKTLMDTVQLVQSLRNCLPAPHIQVNSWKSETEPRPRSEAEVAAAAVAAVARNPQG